MSESPDGKLYEKQLEKVGHYINELQKAKKHATINEYATIARYTENDESELGTESGQRVETLGMKTRSTLQTK